MRARQESGGGEQQDQQLGGGQGGLQPLAQPQQQGQDGEIAQERHQADQRDASQAEVGGESQELEPSPARRRAAPGPVLVGGQVPQRRKLLEGHEGGQQAARVNHKSEQRGAEGEAARRLEPAGVGPLNQLLAAHDHAPRPRSSARPPASSMTAITMRRTTEAGVRVSRRAPRRAPSITPRMAGTASAGSRAPRWMYTQAAELFTMEMIRPLVPTATLSGAAISRLRAGTLAKPAPRPNTPPKKPMPANAANPATVRRVRQSMARPSAGSWYLPRRRRIVPSASVSPLPAVRSLVRQMRRAIATTVAPSASCTRSVGKASPTSAPANEAMEPDSASGTARRRLAMRFSSNVGPAASVPASAKSRPAPRTKSR